MATITALTEDFAGVVVGEDITALNTIFSKVTGTPPVCITDPYDSTRKMMRVAPVAFTSIGELTFTAVPLLWFCHDFDIEEPLATASGGTAILNGYPTDAAVAADKIFDIRQTAGARTIELRNVNNIVWTSAPLAAGQKHRIYAMYKGGATPADRRIRLQIVSGGDLSGAVTQDSGEIASSTTASLIGHMRMGAIGSSTGAARFGRFRADNAVAPYPVPTVTTTPPTNTAAPVVTAADGTPQVGEVLVSTAGTWTGNPTPILTGQWKRNGAPVENAMDPVFTPTQTGSYRFDVTGTNTDPGSPVTVQSNAVAVTAATVVALSGAPATQVDTATIKVTNPTNGTAPYTHAIAQLAGPATTARLVTGQAGWWAVERQASVTTWRVTTTDAVGSTPLARDVAVQPAGAGGSTVYRGTSTGWVEV